MHFVIIEVWLHKKMKKIEVVETIKLIWSLVPFINNIADGELSTTENSSQKRILEISWIKSEMKAFDMSQKRILT